MQIHSEISPHKYECEWLTVFSLEYFLKNGESQDGSIHHYLRGLTYTVNKHCKLDGRSKLNNNTISLENCCLGVIHSYF